MFDQSLKWQHQAMKRISANAFHLNRFAQRTREIDREFLHKRCDRAMAEAAAWDAAAASA